MRDSQSAVFHFLLLALVTAAVYPAILIYSLLVDTLFGDRFFLSMVQFGSKAALVGILLQDWMKSLPYAFLFTIAVFVAEKVGTKYFSGNYSSYLLIATMLITAISLPFFSIGWYSLSLSIFVATLVSSLYYLANRTMLRAGRAY